MESRLALIGCLTCLRSASAMYIPFVTHPLNGIRESLLCTWTFDAMGYCPPHLRKFGVCVRGRVLHVTSLSAIDTLNRVSNKWMQLSSFRDSYMRENLGG
jgi:hypothetical protein